MVSQVARVDEVTAMMWVLLILGLYFVFFNMKFSLFTVLVIYFVWFQAIN